MIVRKLTILAGVAVAALAAAPAQAETYRLMTGPQGGVWVPLGGALKNLWERAIPGLTVQTLPGAGIANVRGIDEGKAEIGFGNSISTVDGITGADPYPKRRPMSATSRRSIRSISRWWRWQTRRSIPCATSRASRSRCRRAATRPRLSRVICCRRTASNTTT